jgi:hypothetical protein
MKLIEALKQIKDLQRKADDLQEKVAQHSAHLNLETPVYADQRKQVKEWIQAHSDILKEILRLRIAIQRTNLETPVEIHLNGRGVTKSIAEWIHRRRDLAGEERKMWRSLTDKNLKEGITKNSNEQVVEVKIVRCYDPAERDEKLFGLDCEPSTIDSKLEIVNAVTDLIE